jgi:hypothetical protein
MGGQYHSLRSLSNGSKTKDKMKQGGAKILLSLGKRRALHDTTR